MRPAAILAPLILAAAPFAAVQIAQAQTGQTPTARLGNLTYRVPPGWTAEARDGVVAFTPRDLPVGGVAFAILAPDVPLSGDLRAWFEARVAGLHENVRVVSVSAVEAGKDEKGSPVYSRAAAVVDGSGRPQYRFYVAGQFGPANARRAALLVFQASGLDLVARYQDGLSALADSVDEAPAANSTKAAPAPTAKAAPPRPAANAAPPGPTQAAPAALPPLKTLSAADLVRAGRDPAREPAEGEFRCYEQRAGDDVARPHLVVQILPGRQYRTADGSGAFALESSSSGSLHYVAWRGGPLGDSDRAWLLFTDEGQYLELDGVGPKNRSYGCYQAGGREEYAKAEFRMKTPLPGKYACVGEKGPQPEALEILPGGAYRFAGGTGRYRADLLRDQNRGWGDVDFEGGPLDDRSATFQERAGGLREFSFSRPALVCGLVAKPTALPRYGAAKAPAPPKGAGGLKGVYASWRMDPMLATGGTCGGLCWDLYVFHPNGYVYTREPDEGLADADCTRTKLNGLPVCEVYRVENGKIRIGDDGPRSFAKTKTGLKIDGRDLEPVRPVDGLKLEGRYDSQSVMSAGVGTGGAVFQRGLVFRKDGTFRRQSSSSGFFGATDTGTSFGNVTASASFSNDRRDGGTYRFVGNTLELKFGDGHVERAFAFLPQTKGGKPDTSFVRIGGRDYSLDDGKK